MNLSSHFEHTMDVSHKDPDQACLFKTKITWLSIGAIVGAFSACMASRLFAFESN